MAGSVIGALRVDLGLNSAQFIKGTKNAESAMKGMSLKMAAAGAAIGAALGAATAAAVNLARDAVNVADEISKSAVKIGIGTEELSRLRYAADLSGVSFQGLEKGLLILNRNMAQAAEGSGKAATAFASMGINVSNADGTLKTTTQVLAEMADVFATMPDGAQKSALAMAVLGKSGADMIPLINGGSGALKELTEEASRFGIVIDEETGRRAEEFNDNLSRLQGVFSSLATRIAAEMLPSLVGLQTWLISNQDAILGAARSVVEFGGSLVRLVQSLAPLLAGFAAYRAALLAASAAQAVYVAGMTAFSFAVGGARAATIALNTALISNPFTAVAVAVGTLTAAFIGMRNAQAEARAETNNLITSLKALAGARGADFISRRNEAVVSLLTKQAELARLEKQLGAQTGQAAGFAAEALGPKIRSLREQVSELEAGIEQADNSAKAAAAAMRSINVPAADAGVALTSAGAAARNAGGSFRAAGDDLQRLTDRLFPYQAAMRQLDADEALIRSQKNLTEARKEELLAALEQERFRTRTRGLGQATVSGGLLNTDPIIDAAEEFRKTQGDLARDTEVKTVRIAESFAQMSQRITSSLQGLANSVRSGDFLGILGGVLDIFTSLGSAGVFGSGLQGSLNSIPSFAGGGFTGNGARTGGLDGKGGYLAMLHPRETVLDHTKGQGMGGRVHVTVSVDKSGNLQAFVDDQIMSRAPMIASASASLAQGQMAQRAQRRVR